VITADQGGMMLNGPHGPGAGNCDPETMDCNGSGVPGGCQGGGGMHGRNGQQGTPQNVQP